MWQMLFPRLLSTRGLFCTHLAMLRKYVTLSPMKPSDIFVPTILSDQPRFVQSEMDRYASLRPKPRRVQIDIIDGSFVDNITVEAGFVRGLENHGMIVDLHLMVEEPVNHLEEIVMAQEKLGVVVAQVERMSSQAEYIDIVTQDLGLEAGLALDLYTPFSAIEEDLIDQLAVVQVMCGKAGWEGQEFESAALRTIQEAAEYRDLHGLNYHISVDIGINNETLPDVREAGATMFIMNTYLQGENGQEHWQELVKG